MNIKDFKFNIIIQISLFQFFFVEIVLKLSKIIVLKNNNFYFCAKF